MQSVHPGVPGRDGVAELVEALTTTFAGMAAPATLIPTGGYSHRKRRRHHPRRAAARRVCDRLRQRSERLALQHVQFGDVIADAASVACGVRRSNRKLFCKKESPSPHRVFQPTGGGVAPEGELKCSARSSCERPLRTLLLPRPGILERFRNVLRTPASDTGTVGMATIAESRSTAGDELMSIVDGRRLCSRTCPERRAP